MLVRTKQEVLELEAAGIPYLLPSNIVRSRHFYGMLLTLGGRKQKHTRIWTRTCSENVTGDFGTKTEK